MSKNQDLYIYADRLGDDFVADNKAINKFLTVAQNYNAIEHGGNRLRIHLVLRNQILASTLRRLPLEPCLSQNLELYAYTMEDLWALDALGIIGSGEALIDRETIGVESDKVVHFVIFGGTSLAQSLIINTSLIAHFPNFCRDSSLRTRITWVGDSFDDFDSFKQQYKVLLKNSWRRDVCINGDNVVIDELAPLYINSRREFVDIEWEFVETKPFSDILTYKIKKWSEDENQILTLAYCYHDDQRNLELAMTISQQICNDIPILVKQSDDSVLNILKKSESFANLAPIGVSSEQVCMENFIRMAQCVHYAYSNMRASTKEEQQNGASEMVVVTELPRKDELQHLWNNLKLTTSKRWSNVYNAISVSTKMRSLGYSMKDWNKLIAIKESDVQILSEVEHNRWSVEELILGYVPTTDEEHQAIITDISNREKFKSMFKHDDLRHYSELGVDDSGLSVKRYDVALTRSLPLIVYSYYKEIMRDE